MQISKVLSRNLVTIPRDVVKALDIHPGDYLKVKREGTIIRMVPIVIEEKWSGEEMAALRKLHQIEKHRSQRVHSKSEIRKELNR